MERDINEEPEPGYLGHSLDGHEETYSTTWEQVEERMNKKRRRRFLFWFFPLGLLGLVMGGLWMVTTKDQPKMLASKPLPSKTAEVRPSGDSQMESQPDSEKENKPLEKANDVAIASETNKTNPQNSSTTSENEPYNNIKPSNTNENHPATRPENKAIATQNPPENLTLVSEESEEISKFKNPESGIERTQISKSPKKRNHKRVPLLAKENRNKGKEEIRIGMEKEEPLLTNKDQKEPSDQKRSKVTKKGKPWIAGSIKSMKNGTVVPPETEGLANQVVPPEEVKEEKPVASGEENPIPSTLPPTEKAAPISAETVVENTTPAIEKGPVGEKSGSADQNLAKANPAPDSGVAPKPDTLAKEIQNKPEVKGAVEPKNGFGKIKGFWLASLGFGSGIQTARLTSSEAFKYSPENRDAYFRIENAKISPALLLHGEFSRLWALHRSFLIGPFVNIGVQYQQLEAETNPGRFSASRFEYSADSTKIQAFSTVPVSTEVYRRALGMADLGIQTQWQPSWSPIGIGVSKSLIRYTMLLDFASSENQSPGNRFQDLTYFILPDEVRLFYALGNSKQFFVKANSIRKMLSILPGPASASSVGDAYFFSAGISWKW
jgi:hypothetical protein